MGRVRRGLFASLLAMALLPSAAAASPLDRIELPVGWQPEGITTDGHVLYAGSLANGALLRADPATGQTTVLPKSETRKPAVGIDYDRRRRALWVAGGPAGEIRAHHARSGRLLATFTAPPAESGSRFVNDLVVKKRWVYATDSVNQELVVVRIPRTRVPRSKDATVLPLTGDLVYQEGFNANGIVKSGPWLLVVQSNTGKLFRVDRSSGETVEVDLGGASLSNGDGMEIDGDTLFVVRNRLSRIAVVDIEGDLTSGEVEEELVVPDSDVPTTTALLDGSLWLVNARFGVAEPSKAEYWMTRVSLDGVDTAR